MRPERTIVAQFTFSGTPGHGRLGLGVSLGWRRRWEKAESGGEMWSEGMRTLGRD